MTTIYEIPLAGVHEKFNISLSGTTYRLTVTYRPDPGPGWLLDLATEDGTPLLNSLPLVTGHDLLEQHTHLGIPGQLWVASDSEPFATPTYGTLGVSSHLYYVTP